MAQATREGSSRSKRTRKKSPPKKPEAEAPEETEEEAQADEQAAEEQPVEEEPVEEEPVEEEPAPEAAEAEEPPTDEEVEVSEHVSGSAEQAARRAARYIADFAGKRPESVISIERLDDGWKVGVEVVESARIPDTADILATYEVELERDGTLRSYRRIRRYARGQLDRTCR